MFSVTESHFQYVYPFLCSQNVDEDVVAKASVPNGTTRNGAAAGGGGRHGTHNAAPEAYEPMGDASESDSDEELAQPVLARNSRTGCVRLMNVRHAAFSRIPLFLFLAVSLHVNDRMMMKTMTSAMDVDNYNDDGLEVGSVRH